MSAISEQRVANLTKQVLQKMRNNECFKSFYSTVVTKSKKHLPSRNQPYLGKNEHLAGLNLEQGPNRIQHYRNITDAYTLRRLT